MRINWRWSSAAVLVAALAAILTGTAFGFPGGSGGGDNPVLGPSVQPIFAEGEGENELLERDAFFTTRRTAGDIPLDNQQAGALRAAAARTAARLRKDGVPASGPSTFQGAWTAIGPNPITQVLRSSNTLGSMSGRIGALAIRPSNGQFILGGAQGGIWLFDPGTGQWIPKTDNLPSLSIGALAIAPSNDAIVYAGTGEGALSGDSYFGNGVIKSTDGGANWLHVSGDYFEGVSISRIVVDPTNANHLYAAVLRGRGGARRTTPTVHSKYGIWESKDGGANWTLLKEAKSESNGATDLEIDPQSPSILYASFWGDAIYKSTDGGATWAPIMNGLPAGDFAASQTRFSISLSHPASQPATLYAGFDWADAAGDHPARVFKSTNGGASWAMLPAGSGADSVQDYCGTQCFYDNVIEADPTNPDVVFAGGSFGYNLSPQSGGIFRSTDGGQTWENLGWDQHPDFHALAFDPSNTMHVLVGSDGGVWYSPDRGGRPSATQPLSAADWTNLNGRSLQIAQYTSVATNPTLPVRFWGGTQDNGTLRKSAASNTWFDLASGDGGQVLVDPTDFHYVYGTYFGISPYRYTDGGAAFFSNQFIRSGINLGDRAEFYVPWVMNKDNPNQLFLGTYRLYRTDNAKAPAAGDVKWRIVSPDLTSGCTGTAPNGGRGCFISAIGIGGGDAIYTGSEEGWIYVSTDAKTAATPTWTRVGIGKVPDRPVTQFAVDRSNYRIAYASFAGFNAATPSRPGHVFKTSDGGQTWADISGNLPDSPVNSVVLDPSYANTLYVGTDVGPFVTYNSGVNWYPLGTGIPPMAVWQLDLDPSHRVLAAGTHGRGAWRSADSATVPALVLAKADAGVPIGPASSLQYTLTLKNIGNADATGVTITDPVPANTSFVSADNGGANAGGTVSWTGLTVPMGGSVSVHMTVSVANALKNKVKAIVDDGYGATSAQGPSTTGSPTVTPIAPSYAVSLSPATQTDGAKAGDSVTYTVTLKNLGFSTDSYTMSSTGGTFAVSFFDGTCTTPLTTTASVAPGSTTNVCVKVSVPAGASNGDTSTATVTATSVGSPGVSASGTVKTIAVTVATLLVDDDGNGPDVQSYYTTALNTAGVAFSTWDLAADSNLPAHYMRAFANIVWFTGNTYPGPILPYEASLKAFLDNGGRLFISGQDLLDQAAGTTAFVHDYLHVTWDGSETQNDKATANVHGVLTSPVTTGIGTVPLDTSVLGNSFMDEITPNGGALSAFTDDATQPDALSYAGTYKVVFLAFPFEEYGAAADRADLVSRVMSFFGP
jgi:photosystem II stability/assembly factor-like uncharacterized protein